MNLRALMHMTLAVSLLCCALVAGAAEVIRFGYLALSEDPRYDERKAYFRTLSRPLGAPFAGAEVALREARFVGQALGVSFELAPARGVDAPALVAEVDKLYAEGVRHFLIDAPGKVVAEVAAATRGRALLLFNVAAPDDALRQAQCQAHLYHTLPSHSMQTDALAQFLVSRKWRSVLLLQGPRDDDRLIGAAFENSARRLGLKIVNKKDFVLSNDPRERDLGNPLLLTSTAVGEYDAVWVVDSDGEFSRRLPYNTARPRPVVGDAGLVAEAWAPRFERFGAPQLARRFQRAAQRPMTSPDWAAYMATKAVLQAALEQPAKPDAAAITKVLNRADFNLDGFKGVRLSFRPWDRQLRQPLLMTDGMGIIATAPVEGMMHPKNVLDTLGTDAAESPCKAKP
jgi:ABC transporter substrate binding protein (PQQ-dependent alcohol dehydrogenase system)